MKNTTIRVFLRVLLAGLFSGTLLFSSCAKNSISDRDAKREQLKSAAETKRQELQLVAGNYSGTMIPNSGEALNILLNLEIKDIPTPVEGQVDPIPVPTLKGYMKLPLGENQIGVSIDKADFDVKNKKLDLVVGDANWSDTFISCIAEGTKLEGTWTQPKSAYSGKIRLERMQNQGNTSQAEALAGEYGGVLFHEGKDLYQFGQITLTTSVKPAEGLKVTGLVKIIYGGWESTEYLTYRFDPVQFNLMTGQMIFKSETNDLILNGYWTNGQFNGDWYSTYTGKIGKITFKKKELPHPQSGTIFEALKGTYQGKLTNTNPQSNLPERMMVSFVTSQDISKPNGISVTGSLRLYLGAFGSNEYVEYPFSEVHFNFYTRNFTAKANGDYKLTLKADTKQTQIVGTVSADALGEVGKFEVNKL